MFSIIKPSFISSNVLRPQPLPFVKNGTIAGYNVFSNLWLLHLSPAGHTFGSHSNISILQINSKLRKTKFSKHFNRSFGNLVNKLPIYTIRTRTTWVWLCRITFTGSHCGNIKFHIFDVANGFVEFYSSKFWRLL